ncbi:MAG: exonuclease III [Chitinophagales bacterium]
MKIATWNLERLIKNRNEEVLEKIRAIDADILVLTETGEQNVKCII